MKMTEKKLFRYRVFYDDHFDVYDGMYKSIDLYFPEEKTLEWIKDYWFTYWAKPTECSTHWDFIKVCQYFEHPSLRRGLWIDIN